MERRVAARSQESSPWPVRVWADRGRVWWVCGVCGAPLLYGAVTAEGQAVVGILFALALLRLAGDHGGDGAHARVCPAVWGWLACGVLLVPLVPLPPEFVGWLSPERLALARRFPLEAGEEAAWITLALSPTGAMRRLGELALIVTAFWLARGWTARHGAVKPLVVGLTIAVTSLAVSEAWSRLSGSVRLAGLWPDPAGHAAGTFANRNHCANWIYMAALFVAGGLMDRWGYPTNLRVREVGRGSGARAVLVWAAVVFGLVMAVGTGSRGAMAGLAAGSATWVLLMVRSGIGSGRGGRAAARVWLVAGAMGFVALLLMVGASNPLLGRLARLPEDATFKTAIWRDTLSVGARFAGVGVGPGGFQAAFDHYKSFGGDRTFVHAENDGVQLLAEHGVIGALVLGGLLGMLVWRAMRFGWRRDLGEPGAVAGALAGLVAFGVQSLVDFVSHVPANAMLAATLLGFIIGLRDRQRQPVVVPPPCGWRLARNWGWAAGVAVLAGVHGAAWFCWQRSLVAPNPKTAAVELDRSLRVWPWDVERQIARARAWVRAAAYDGRDVAAIRRGLTGALATDPLNWELRLERAWLDLAFAPADPRGASEAWEVVRMNPRQPAIPLQFARHYASRDPDLARRFLKAAPVATVAEVGQALAVAWELDRDPAALWEFAPATAAGMRALEGFARHRGLRGLERAAR